LRAGMILIVDALLAGIAFFIAFIVRYESDLRAAQVHNVLVSLPVVMLSYAAVSFLGRTFDISWQWFVLRDAVRVGRAVFIGAALAWAGMWAIGVRYPADLMLVFGVLCFALSAGLRSSLRALHTLFEDDRAARLEVNIDLMDRGVPKY
jgi:FlaA1/EpsC-like NDP-sugar epimerase